MNEESRQKLTEMIKKHGSSVCQDKPRCKGLVLDYCSSYEKEARLLALLLEMDIPVTLLNKSSQKTSTEWLLNSLTQKACDAYSLDQGAARWGVEAWAKALGLSVPAPKVDPKPTRSLSEAPPKTSNPYASSSTVSPKPAYEPYKPSSSSSSTAPSNPYASSSTVSPKPTYEPYKPSSSSTVPLNPYASSSAAAASSDVSYNPYTPPPPVSPKPSSDPYTPPLILPSPSYSSYPSSTPVQPKPSYAPPPAQRRYLRYRRRRFGFLWACLFGIIAAGLERVLDQHSYFLASKIGPALTIILLLAVPVFAGFVTGLITARKRWGTIAGATTGFIFGMLSYSTVHEALSTTGLQGVIFFVVVAAFLGFIGSIPTTIRRW